ncbi:pyridoxal phosphate-dependent aminotransferase [Anaerovorax odorimutans]|uniref:pyridoxal phosphate-dependent aminotransferase n=1 Tax=Anaerovorax odorimutans TaxID=109327 RepID=UPI0003FC6223|nr:pyridoxal phosphate-dependent aminotransferase [Anaerovorax odorimutans]
MKQLSNKMLSMKPSSVRKLTKYADEAEIKGKKIYKLNIGQPDLRVPKEYYDRIREYNEPTIEYMPSNGIPELILAVQKYYNESGIDIEKDNIAITTGGTEAVLFTLLALTNPEDEYIIFEPYYSNYNTFFTITGATPVPVTTYAENGFHFSKKDLESKITPKTKAIWVTNPGNPTGSVLTDEEIEAICDMALKYDLFIVADEVYREMVFDGRKIKSFGYIDNIQDRLVIIDSVSKRFNACGARIGVVISKNKEFFSVISKLCQGRLAVSTIEQQGAVGLYSTGFRVINEIRSEFEKRRNIIYNNLIKIPGVICEKPEGAFYVVCKLPVEDTTEFLIWMLQNFDIDGETVMAAPADGFYATEGLGKDEIRIAYILEEDKLERAMYILAKGIEAYNNK